MARLFEVIVGNVGCVHVGASRRKALSVYNDYVFISRASPGSRAFKEDVTLMADGEISLEYIGNPETKDECGETP
jgi:hypothetical protein